jgi:hypothetical protein
MISVRKGTHHMPKRVFSWVPVPDSTRFWNDADVYAWWGLSKDEEGYCENFVKDFPMFREAKPAKAPKAKAEKKQREPKTKPQVINLDSQDFDRLANANPTE